MDLHDAGEAVVTAIESWWRSGRRDLVSLLESFPDVTGPRPLRLALLVQLRLGELLSGAEALAMGSREAAIALFVQRSMAIRHSFSKVASDEIVSALVGQVFPRKYALTLLGRTSNVSRRYFRDIDFGMRVELFPSIWPTLRNLDFVAGDIDPTDWRVSTVTAEGTLLEQLPGAREVHFFRLRLLNDDLLETLWHEVSSRYPKLVETQFYCEFQGRFYLRTFLDIEFQAGNQEFISADENYLSTWIGALTSDVRKRRVGMNQYLELLDLLSARVGFPASGTEREQPLGTQIAADARLGAVFFVAEKLRECRRWNS
jgi:hypothetical protein